MADLSLKAVRKQYGHAEIIKGIDLDIKHGEFIVFVGPSGCGKSTLLRMIAGLEEISGGNITIGNRVVNNLPPKDRSIAMVFQSYALFPHMTVRDNIAFGLMIAGETKSEIDSKVADAAKILKLDPLLDRKPSQLSGGQRQRVAIGRAIVRNPDVFLFDEPLSNLDAALRVNTRAEIAKLHRDLGATMIYVTHDQVEAMTLADRIAVLDGGIVRQFGAPMDLYRHPDNLFVAGFIGSPKMNFLPVRVVSSSADNVTVEGQGFWALTLKAKGSDLSAGTQLTLGIRPEHIALTNNGDARHNGKIVLIERLGHQTFIEITDAHGQSVTALVDADQSVELDEAVSLNYETAKCHLFDQQGQNIRSNI